MRVSAILPNSGPVPLELGIDAMAQAAEKSGAHGLWVSDHLVLQAGGVTDYPYSKDGRITWDPRDAYLEALCTCAFLCGVTSGCRIGTAVLVLPQRQVLQTAKELATIDNLSAGRLTVGIGTGWNRAEMEALGHRFDTRGDRIEDMITVLRECWSGRTALFDGDELKVPEDLLLHPTPVQHPGPPLLVGGMSRRAIRRAARRGDGWLALAFADRWDVAGLARAVTYHDAQVEAATPYSSSSTKVLKMHCSPPQTDLLPGRLEEVAALGFDEVAIELPWALGIDEASGLLAGLVTAWN